MNFSLLENRSTNKGTVVPRSDDARIRIWEKVYLVRQLFALLKDKKTANYSTQTPLTISITEGKPIYACSPYHLDFISSECFIFSSSTMPVLSFCFFFWKIKPVRWISLYDKLALCVAVVSCLRNPLEWKYCLKMERTRKRLTCETLVVDTKHNKRSKVSYTFV